MKNIVSEQRSGPPNCPVDGDVFIKMLEAMTVEELTDGLDEALESITEENYDPALIDAYLAALDQKDSMPEVPDAEASFANFKNRLLLTFPEKNDGLTRPSRRVRSMRRVGLVAALVVVCLMGCMVVAQAAGVDVFGAIARWTDEVFSLGAIRSEGADDGGGNPDLENIANNVNADVAYESLQEALDDCGITEVREPTWIPDGYVFESVEVDSWPVDNSFIGLFAKYYDGANFLQIQIGYYDGNANMQVEKTDASIETFLVDDLTVYLLENVNSNSAAWATEHYECYISGSVERQILKQIVLSSYAPIQ